MKVLLNSSSLLVAMAFLYTETSLAQSGWYQQPPWPTTEFLSGVATPDSNTIVAAGYRGTIVRSTDGGATWTQQVSGTTNNLTAVSFVDANTGTVVGTFGTILRTTDGGETWNTQVSWTGVTLIGVTFLDEMTGTVVGQLGTILHTTDGGETWSRLASGTNASLWAVSFVDATTEIAVGDFETILRTTDGGDSWTRQLSGSSSQVLAGVSFVDATTGTAVGGYQDRFLGLIFITTLCARFTSSMPKPEQRLALRETSCVPTTAVKRGVVKPSTRPTCWRPCPSRTQTQPPRSAIWESSCAPRTAA